MEFVEPLITQLQSYWVGFMKMTPQIALTIVVLIATWLISSFVGRIVSRVLKTANLRRALIDLMQTLASVAVWSFGLLLAATVLFPSITPAQLLGALGVGGIAVGLAFRDIFENFLAGALIMIREPMRIGDIIEVDDIQGRVEEITLRDTYVRKLSNELVLLPNSMLFKNAVEVKTHHDNRRYEIVVGVGYGEDVEEARKVITEAVNGVNGLAQDKDVDVFASEFSDSSINFNVRWWAQSEPKEMHVTRSRIVIAIKKALDEAGIEIPFPYRTLTFSEPLQFEKHS